MISREAISVYICFLLIAPSVFARDTPPNDLAGFWSVQLENDLWGSGDDRFYTHGTEISYASTDVERSPLTDLTDWIPFYRKGDVGIHGFSVGQQIFTPDNIQRQDLIKEDRPYAGWLFWNIGIAHSYENTGVREGINGFLVSLGVVGPASGAAQVQRAIHGLTGSEKPRGWDNQLKSELGVNFAYLQKWRRFLDLDAFRWLEFSHHRGFMIGNVYTYAAGGFMVRWGTGLSNDIGPPSISPGFTGVPAFRPHPEMNWYLFAGVEGRAMARNLFLDGNTFKESHSVEKKHFVSDLVVGLAFHIKGMRIALSNLRRSREFEGQPEPERYGAINLTIYTNP